MACWLACSWPLVSGDTSGCGVGGRGEAVLFGMFPTRLSTALEGFSGLPRCFDYFISLFSGSESPYFRITHQHRWALMWTTGIGVRSKTTYKQNFQQTKNSDTVQQKTKHQQTKNSDKQKTQYIQQTKNMCLLFSLQLSSAWLRPPRRWWPPSMKLLALIGEICFFW